MKTVALFAFLSVVAICVATESILTKNQGYFAKVPVEKIHTMRVYEDGSFVIEYQDKTSEEGCLPEGLCND